MGSPNRRGAKPVLDEMKKRRIVALLANGCTRCTAARVVQCSPSTIQRTAERDPVFGQQVAQAEQGQEIWSASTVTRVCREDKYWRAAAWVLERRSPEVYGKPQPGKYSGRDVLRILGEVLDAIDDDLTPELRRRIGDKIRGVLEERVAQEMPFLFHDLEATGDEATPPLVDKRPEAVVDDPRPLGSDEHEMGREHR